MSQVIGKTRFAYSRVWHFVDVGAATQPSRSALSLASTSSEATNVSSTSLSHAPAAPTPVPLGRLATRIALTLMGKNKPIYNPSTDCGDYVVAVGCHDLHVTGKKLEQKLYYTHTTRPGSLKSMNMERLKAKWGGAEILRRAVRGMLPKNRLREKRLARLKTFEGLAHPYKQNLMQFPSESYTHQTTGQLSTS
ncbi:MAG: hypothetical protein Q9159_006679 [Coniocarpon cinnabarinum]